MKINVRIEPLLEEDEIIVCVKQLTPMKKALISKLNNQMNQTLLVYQRGTTHHILIDDILFFETSDTIVYAHTINNLYQTKNTLSNLVNELPQYFLRVSKSTIVNIDKIVSMEKRLSNSSRITFNGSHKIVYVSRRYYTLLKDTIKNRRF